MKERRAAQNKQALAAAVDEESTENTLSDGVVNAFVPNSESSSEPEPDSEHATQSEALSAKSRHDETRNVKTEKPDLEKRPFQRVELADDDNPGHVLRKAREQAGLSMEEIGALTKINERQLEAIESGDAGRLPPETFAKAFIKSYCRVLNIDPRPIIHAYGFTETKALLRTGPAAVDQQVRLESLEAQVSAGSQILSNARLEGKTSGRRSLVYGLVLAALGLMAAFYVPVFLASRNEDGAASQQEASAPPVVQEPEPLPEGFDPNQMADAHGQPVDPSVVSGYPSESAATDPAFAGPAVQPESQPLASASAIQTSPAQTPPVPAVPAVPAAAPPMQNTTATRPAAAPSLGAGQAVLRFAFSGQSWLTVWDGNNQVLVSQDNPAGSAVVLKGNGPFKVIVGKPKAVSLNANGNAVTIAESTPGGVGRLVLR